MPFVPDAEQPKKGFKPDETQPSVSAPSLSNLNKTIADQIAIRGQAAYTGFLSLGTTIAKGLSKIERSIPKEARIGEPVLPEAKTIQDYYDKQYAIKEANKAVQVPMGPLLDSNAMEIYGGIAPTLLAPGSLAVKGAELAGKVVPRVISKTIGAVAGGAAEGSAYGGLFTHPGQSPEEVINQEGTKYGTALGAIAGPGVKYLDSYLNRAAEFEKYKLGAEVDGVPFRGYSFNRDLSGQVVDDTLGNWRRQVGNALLDNLIMGTGGARLANQKYFKETISNYIADLSQSTLGKGKEAIKNKMISVKNLADKSEEEAWTSAYKIFNKEKINFVNKLDNYEHYFAQLPSSSDSLTEKSIAMLRPRQTENLTFKDIHDLKQDVWTARTSIAKKGNRTAEENELLNTLTNMYHGLNTDIKNTVIESGSKEAYRAFESANAYTQGSKFMFDPKNQRELYRAVEDMNQRQEGIQKFINWSLNKNRTSRSAAQVVGILGDTNKQLQAEKLSQMLENSLSADGLMLDPAKWLTEVGKVNSSEGTKLIMQDSIDALSGLNQHIQNAATATIESKAGTAGSSVIQGITGAGVFGGGTVAYMGQPMLGVGIIAGTLLAPKALAVVSQSSPLKSTLMLLNRSLSGKPNPGLSQYLSQKINDQMIKAGLIIHLDDEGNAVLDTAPTEEEKKAFKVSLNGAEPSPLVPKGYVPKKKTGNEPENYYGA